MSIVFHCEHCGKKIEAQDKLGGKWAKCPACHNKIYVPGAGDNNQIRLKPLDQKEEQKKQKLMDETYKLTQNILQERETPETQEIQTDDIDENQISENIIASLTKMAENREAEAEENIQALTANPSKAREILDQIAVSDMLEPKLNDVPPQVLAGLIRKLRNKIS